MCQSGIATGSARNSRLFAVHLHCPCCKDMAQLCSFEKNSQIAIVAFAFRFAKSMAIVSVGTHCLDRSGCYAPTNCTVPISTSPGADGCSPTWWCCDWDHGVASASGRITQGKAEVFCSLTQLRPHVRPVQCQHQPKIWIRAAALGGFLYDR